MSPYLAAHTKKPSRSFGGCVSSRDVARTATETPVAERWLPWDCWCGDGRHFVGSWRNESVVVIFRRIRSTRFLVPFRFVRS